MSEIKIGFKNGAPKLLIDGKPTPPVLYGLSDMPASGSGTAYAQRNIKLFANAGIRLVNIDANLCTGWHKESEFEPSAVLAEISNVCDAVPDAKVLVRLHVNPPYWWLRDNPDECAIYRKKDGDIAGIDDGESDRLIRNDAASNLRASLASQKWINEACEKLELLCDAIKSRPEADMLLGFQIACGIFGEWHQWGTDVSKPMKEYFKSFLKKKYKTDPCLQKAWHDGSVTFETAEFHPEISQGGDDGFFRNPEKSQRVIDSQKCIQSCAPDAILRFCKVVKNKLPDKLAGTFYGYYFGVGGAYAAVGGHLMPQTLYKAKGIIDFLCGPFCYLDNRNADGVPMQRGMLESARLNKILWLTEMDQHPECVPELGGDIKNTASTVATLRRNVLQPLCAGQGLWYYDHRVIPKLLEGHPEFADLGSIYKKRGWWESDGLINEVRKLQNIAKEINESEYIPEADVLLVYSAKSFFFRSRAADPEYGIHEAVARCGVSYACIYEEDLKLVNINQYKCIIFVNCFAETEEERIFKKSLSDKILCIHLYAEGFCDGKTLSEDNISKAVGIKIKRSTAATVINGAGMLSGESVAVPEKTYAPFFAADDPDAEVLGVYDNKDTAIAKKGNDIWIGITAITQGIMQKIFKLCGAHIWCNSGDPIIAGGGIVVINTAKGGKLTLNLKDGKKIPTELQPFTTAAFDVKTGERIL